MNRIPNHRVTCSIYLTEKENKMLDELLEELEARTIGKVSRTFIFCHALKMLHERWKKEDKI